MFPSMKSTTTGGHCPLSSPTFVAHYHCPPLSPTIVSHRHCPPSSPTVVAHHCHPGRPSFSLVFNVFEALCCPPGHPSLLVFKHPCPLSLPTFTVVTHLHYPPLLPTIVAHHCHLSVLHHIWTLSTAAWRIWKRH